jgi:hypothetical protein
LKVELGSESPINVETIEVKRDCAGDMLLEYTMISTTALE